MEGSRLRKTFKLCWYLEAGDIPRFGCGCKEATKGWRSVVGDCGGAGEPFDCWVCRVVGCEALRRGGPMVEVCTGERK